MNIYVAFPLEKEERQLLEQHQQPGEQWYWSQDLAEEKQEAVFQKAELVFGNVPAAWLKGSSSLRWMHLYSAGFDPYLKLDWKGDLKNVRVTNLRGFFGEPVAETAVAGVLALYRKLDELVRLQEKASWKGSALRPQMHLLFRKSVVILGAGAIGQTIARLLQGFECKVTIVSRTKSPTLKDLDQLLPATDILISALPDTAETNGLLDKSKLDLLPGAAIFVNVGRGSVVNEEALVDAIKDQRLLGAVLDVTNKEPLSADHPFWACPGLLLTQHTGGGYKEEITDKVRSFIANLERYRAGRPLEHVVDFDKGY